MPDDSVSNIICFAVADVEHSSDMVNIRGLISGDSDSQAPSPGRIQRILSTHTLYAFC